MEALIKLCEQATREQVDSYPAWAKDASSFFSSLNIKPMEWNTKFDFPLEDFERFRSIFKKEDSEQKFNDMKVILKETLGHDMSVKNITKLLSAHKVQNISSKTNLGELMVSSAIINLLDMLCCIFPYINQNA